MPDRPLPGQGLVQVSVVKRVNRAIGLVPPLAVYVLAVLPPAWFLWQAQTGRLGVEPIKALEHELGELALQVLIATLAVRPVNKWTGINFLKLRRAFGVVTFFYVLLHLLVWLVLDVQFLDQIWADIVKRPYITVGMGAFALMIPLALTSNNLSLRRLGPVRWRRLHRLMYPVVLLGAIHFVMLSKGFQLEPYVYLGVILALLATRVRWAEWRAA